jgi:hypothetical protein
VLGTRAAFLDAFIAELRRLRGKFDDLRHATPKSIAQNGSRRE